MKTFSRNSVSWQRMPMGFTLVEMFVAVTIFILVIIATVSVQIYAMRVYALAATKLSATAQARMALNDIRDQVRHGQILYVGNYLPTANFPPVDFAPIPDGQTNQGNALIIYPSAISTNSFSIFFLQPDNGTTNFATKSSTGAIINTNSLVEEIYTNGTMELSNSVAGYITNQIVFQSQDYENNPLTNNFNNRIVQVTLFFSQWEYPVAIIGTNQFNAYDYYRVQTRITRRLVN